jgi:hypothetical protein
LQEEAEYRAAKDLLRELQLIAWLNK